MAKDIQSAAEEKERRVSGVEDRRSVSNDRRSPDRVVTHTSSRRAHSDRRKP